MFSGLRTCFQLVVLNENDNVIAVSGLATLLFTSFCMVVESAYSAVVYRVKAIISE